MKKYENKFMTDEYTNEINELFANGHQDALTAYGLECANVNMERIIEGALEGFLLSASVTLFVSGTIYLGRKLAKKLKSKKTEETEEATEAK